MSNDNSNALCAQFQTSETFSTKFDELFHDSTKIFCILALAAHGKEDSDYGKILQYIVSEAVKNENTIRGTGKDISKLSGVSTNKTWNAIEFLRENHFIFKRSNSVHSLSPDFLERYKHFTLTENPTIKLTA